MFAINTVIFHLPLASKHLRLSSKTLVMSLLRLPSELLVLTLRRLSFRDIIRSRAVCKHFLILVETSKELRFLIELGAAGADTNNNCPGHMHLKLERLWQANISWANLHWLCRRHFKLAGSGRLIDTSNGIFFHSAVEVGTESPSGTTIEWFRLPSRRSPQATYSPRKVIFCAPVTDFVSCAARDLIVGVELKSSQ